MNNQRLNKHFVLVNKLEQNIFNAWNVVNDIQMILSIDELPDDTKTMLNGLALLQERKMQQLMNTFETLLEQLRNEGENTND